MNVTELLDNNNNIPILGDRNTGKTNILFWLAKNYKGNKEILFYGYPKQDIPYTQIYSLQELASAVNSLILMDEFQRHIKIYSNSTNGDFLEILSTMIHNNNTLVFTTPITQAITKATDNFLDAFVYTQIKDFGSMKNGSKAKRLLQENSFSEVTKWGLNLQMGSLLLISNNRKGVFQFENMGVGKDWMPKIPQKSPKKNKKR